jgi:hypothetical protein
MKVESGVVMFEKESNRQTLTVPAQRIEDVLGAAPDEAPTVILNGRLQWVTVAELWNFFPEKPAPNDSAGLGFGKERPRDNPGVPAHLQSRCGWSLQANVPARLQEGCAVFYDEDGKYLCSTGQILLVRPLHK